MFGSFRRHQKWIWILVVIVIIPTFLAFFSPADALKDFVKNIVAFFSPNSKPVSLFGSIYGKPVTQGEYLSVLREARLDHFFRSQGREWPAEDESSKRNLERTTLFRLLLIQKMQELDIHVSDQAVARLAKDRLGDYPLANFERDHLLKNNLTQEDFERFMRHEAGLQQLVAAAAASSKLLNPREAEIIYRKEHEELATEVAAFWGTNFLDQVKATPAEVAGFYTNRMAFYRIPERIQVAYVAFPASNYLADADTRIAELTNFNAIINEEYFKRDPNQFKGTNGVVLSEAEAKAKIKEDFRENLALQKAHIAANDFGTLLYAKSVRTAPMFESLAASNKLTVQVTAPFDRQTGLDETQFPPAFETNAFRLSPLDAVHPNPIIGNKAIYVIALKNRLASENPPYEKVQEKVTADFKRFQSLDLARRAGTNFYTLLTNGLAQKKSFTQLSTENKVTVVHIPPFSASTTTLSNLDERVSMQLLKGLTYNLEPGKASELQPTPEGAVILYLREKLPFDEAKVKQELPEFLARLRTYRQNEAFNNWFRKQFEAAKVTLPPHDSDKAGPPQGRPQ